MSRWTVLDETERSFASEDVLGRRPSLISWWIVWRRRQSGRSLKAPARPTGRLYWKNRVIPCHPGRSEGSAPFLARDVLSWLRAGPERIEGTVEQILRRFAPQDDSGRAAVTSRVAGAPLPSPPLFRSDRARDISAGALLPPPSCSG